MLNSDMMNHSELFTIIIPAYNEQGSIKQVLEELIQLYHNKAEIIVIDDGSSDNTTAVVRNFSQVRLICLKRNYGYGAAVKTGIIEASHELVCLFDADGQHNAADVQRLVNAIGSCDMAVGSRGISAFKNLIRAPGKLVLHVIANFLVGKRIPDLNSGLRVIRKDVLLAYLHLLPDGFSASTTTTMILLSRNYDITYVPIATARRIGKSQVSQIRDGYSTTMLIVRLILLFNPMKFFSWFSFTVVGLGSIYATYKLVQTGAQEGLSVGSLLIILSGVLSFIFGLICDQIASLRLERFENVNRQKHFEADSFD